MKRKWRQPIQKLATPSCSTYNFTLEKCPAFKSTIMPKKVVKKLKKIVTFKNEHEFNKGFNSDHIEQIKNKTAKLRPCHRIHHLILH